MIILYSYGAIKSAKHTSHKLNDAKKNLNKGIGKGLEVLGTKTVTKEERFNNHYKDYIIQAEIDANNIIYAKDFTCIKYVMNMDLLSMNKEKRNYIISLATIVSKIRNKTPVDINDSVTWISDMFCIKETEKFNLVIDLLLGNYYKIFGLINQSKINIEYINNLKLKDLNSDRTLILSNLLNVDENTILNLSKHLINYSIVMETSEKE